MEYSINELSKLAGISTRTLRYYDQSGLLKPAAFTSSGWRIYTQAEADLLQQILFFRELGFSLGEIKNIVHAEDFDRPAALENHLKNLIQKKERTELLISTVKKTISSLRGETEMSDNEKFVGFKEKLIKENEEKYGKEVREKYGEEAAAESYAKLTGMTEQQTKSVQELSEKLNEKLKEAVLLGDPSGELAQQVCEMHKEWLCNFWSSYTKQAHLGLAQMYTEDPRFKAYYDKTAEGTAEFLRAALEIYLKA